MSTATETAFDSQIVQARTAGKRRSLARHLPTVARVLLGLCFLVFGADYFLHYFPPPKGPFPAGAMAFGGALAQTGYMFGLIKGTEVAVGLLLLSGRFVALALTAIAPVIVNIVLFHIFLEPAGLPLAFVILALELFLAWSYRDAFRGVLAQRPAPAR